MSNSYKHPDFDPQQDQILKPSLIGPSGFYPCPYKLCLLAAHQWLIEKPIHSVKHAFSGSIFIKVSINWFQVKLEKVTGFED